LTRLLAVAGIVAISFSAIFVRLAEASPVTTALYRNALALPVLVVVWLAMRSRDERSLRLRLMAALAGMFLALDLTLWHNSIEAIGAGLATVLANTQVLFVGLIAWAVHRERPTALALGTIPVVFVGVTLISGLGREGAYGDDPVAGAALGVGAGVAYTGFLLVFRASNRGLAPAAGPLLDATLGAAAGSLLAAGTDADFTFSLTWEEFGWLLALAMVAQVVGWLLIAEALPRVPALETSVLLLLQPMLTVVWGLLIFTERLSALQWAGVALVLGGVAALTLRGSVDRPAEAPAEP
jgi:drug/metabolite transporter (DMT)-like permease